MNGEGGATADAVSLSFGANQVQGLWLAFTRAMALDSSASKIQILRTKTLDAL